MLSIELTKLKNTIFKFSKKLILASVKCDNPRKATNICKNKSTLHKF